MDHFQYHPLLTLGLLLIAGYLAGIAATFFRLPRVSGYIVAGLILSPSISGILNRGQVENLLDFVSVMALSIIAYAIGGSLQMSSVKVLGKPILWISVIQVLAAFVFALLSIYIAGFFYPFLRANGPEAFFCTALIIGAISAATAPATVLAVVHELRAQGPLTTTLLGVVALDDAFTVMLFSGAITVANQLLHVGVESNWGLLLSGVLEIAGALTVGALGGYLLPFIVDARKRVEVKLVVILGAIFFIGGVAIQLEFSPLLANMMMGFIIINKIKPAKDMFRHLATIEEPLYCLFFTLAGAHFDIGVLTSSICLGLALLLGRFTGKLAGTLLGSHISQAPAMVRKYLGLALLPQAGLSLGLIFLARPYLPAGTYDLLLNAMLASIIMNELISPPMLKWALNRAGETNLE